MEGRAAKRQGMVEIDGNKMVYQKRWLNACLLHAMTAGEEACPHLRDPHRNCPSQYISTMVWTIPFMQRKYMERATNSDNPTMRRSISQRVT